MAGINLSYIISIPLLYDVSLNLICRTYSLTLCCSLSCQNRCFSAIVIKKGKALTGLPFSTISVSPTGGQTLTARDNPDGVDNTRDITQ